MLHVAVVLILDHNFLYISDKSHLLGLRLRLKLYPSMYSAHDPVRYDICLTINTNMKTAVNPEKSRYLSDEFPMGECLLGSKTGTEGPICVSVCRQECQERGDAC